MKSLTEFIQKNRVVKLFTYIFLSICIIFFVNSIIELTPKIVEYKKLSTMNESDLDKYFSDVEEEASTYYEPWTDEEEMLTDNDPWKDEEQKSTDNDSGLDEERQHVKDKKVVEELQESYDMSDKMKEKHSVAISILRPIVYELNEEFEILVVSIVFGIIVGLIIYLYETSKSAVRLLIYYIILAIGAVLINKFLLPIITPIHLLTYGYGYEFSINMIYVLAVILALIIIKYIQNKFNIKKLNDLVKKD